MTSVRMTDGQMLHFPPNPLQLDDCGCIIAPGDDHLAGLAAKISDRDILLFAGRLLRAAKKRRHQVKYRHVNAARLKLATMCIGRALDS